DAGARRRSPRGDRPDAVRRAHRFSRGAGSDREKRMLSTGIDRKLRDAIALDAAKRCGAGDRARRDARPRHGRGDVGGVMQSISWTIEQWPVVFSRFDGDQTVADIDAYMTHVQELHQRKQLYVNISWMKEYTRGRAQLTAMGNWVKKVDAGTRAYCVASAIVTESIGFRFLLSTV